MKPLRHAIASVAVAWGVFALTKSWLASCICFLTGFAIDIDHIVDFLLHFAWRDFSFKRCYQACDETGKGKGKYQFKKIFLFLHSLEGAALLWFLTWKFHNNLLFGAAAGYTCHLLLDQIGNPVKLEFYSLLVRAARKFSSEKLFHRNRSTL